MPPRPKVRLIFKSRRDAFGEHAEAFIRPQRIEARFQFITIAPAEHREALFVEIHDPGRSDHGANEFRMFAKIITQVGNTRPH